MPRAYESYNVALGQLSLRQKTGGRPGAWGQRAVATQYKSVRKTV